MKLADCLGASVEFRHDLAIPGFHVILSHPALEHVRALMIREWYRERYDPEILSSPVHCDTPQFVVNWEAFREVDFERPISVTLPVAMPRSGAGMQVWGIGIGEVEGVPDSELLDHIQAQESVLHQYSLGAMSLHSGLRFHHLAPVSDPHPDDMRITLQGHGLFCDGEWRLYW